MWETQQPLDNKTLNRLEAAVSKSSYIGAGQKLKVKNTVRSFQGPSRALLTRMLTLLRSTPTLLVA